MDVITKSVIALYNSLIECKCVFVEDNLIQAFCEVCRDLHVIVHGGALAFDYNNDKTGQYFYID